MSLGLTEIRGFLNERDYDIRKSHNARWIDQKCTPDVLSIIADAIIIYIEGENKIFTVQDIWSSDFACTEIPIIFKKPHPKNNAKAKNEYDKFFGQPIKLFAYAGILSEHRVGKGYKYKVSNISILEYLSLREMNSVRFLNLYIKKVLSDSNLMYAFDSFLENQNDNGYAYVKSAFTDFTINNTPINGKTECGRIFTKIINPLAFASSKKGTYKGRISKDIIRYDELMYNRGNFRDVYSKKPKGITRVEFEARYTGAPNIGYARYLTEKAKKLVRKFNDQYRVCTSEIEELDYLSTPATQIHHIFPQGKYKKIAHFSENLIPLTPSQHFGFAHPGNDTHIVDEEYQRKCVFAKIDTIKEFSEDENTIYSFENLITVLSIGYDLDIFDEVEYNDFETLKLVLLEFYKTIDNKRLF